MNLPAGRATAVMAMFRLRKAPTLLAVTEVGRGSDPARTWTIQRLRELRELIRHGGFARRLAVDRESFGSLCSSDRGTGKSATGKLSPSGSRGI